jgi:hypothetical protein
MIAAWPSPAGEEYALAFDKGRGRRVLVLPAWFDESNKLRHFTVEVMRRLDGAGIDSFLPDLPGCNESAARLELQTVTGWRAAAAIAAQHFRATHVLAIRGGSLLAPPALPGWRYAPISGVGVLKPLLRAGALAAREAGERRTAEELLAGGRQTGLDVAGYRLGAEMVRELEAAQPAGDLSDIPQADVGGGGLWLRAEPDYYSKQADALAAIVAMGLLA